MSIISDFTNLFKPNKRNIAYKNLYTRLIQEDNILLNSFLHRKTPAFIWGNNGAMENRYAASLLIEAINAFRNHLYWSASISMVLAFECNARLILAEKDVGQARASLEVLRRVDSLGKIKKRFINAINVSPKTSFSMGKINVVSNSNKKKVEEIFDLFNKSRNQILAHIDLGRPVAQSKLAKLLENTIRSKTKNGVYTSTDGVLNRSFTGGTMTDYEQLLFESLIFSADDLFIEQYNAIARELMQGLIDFDNLLLEHNEFLLEKQINNSNLLHTHP